MENIYNGNQNKCLSENIHQHLPRNGKPHRATGQNSDRFHHVRKGGL